MPSLTLTFTAPLNTSCQVGDVAYYVDTTSDGGFTTNGVNDVIQIGQIREITNPTSNAPTVICDTMLDGTLHNEVKFILFSKDNKANLSSILGYYADVKFVNNSTTDSELFSIGMEIFESSK